MDRFQDAKVKSVQHVTRRREQGAAKPALKDQEETARAAWDVSWESTSACFSMTLPTHATGRNDCGGGPDIATASLVLEILQGSADGVPN